MATQRVLKPFQGLYFPSINSTLENLFTLIRNAKKNKAHVHKFNDLLKPLVKALSGVNYDFVRQAEFYPDLKETLVKIQNHIIQSTHRTKFSQVMMSKKDGELLDEMEKLIDQLVGRIFLSYSERTRKS